MTAAAFDLLRGDEGLMPILWGRRYRANLVKLLSGDIYHVAEVVRNLSLRARAKYSLVLLKG